MEVVKLNTELAGLNMSESFGFERSCGAIWWRQNKLRKIAVMKHVHNLQTTIVRR